MAKQRMCCGLLHSKRCPVKTTLFADPAVIYTSDDLAQVAIAQSSFCRLLSTQ